MSNTNFSPLLVHALTNIPLEEISTSPSLTDLPGELALLVAKHIDKAPTIFPKHEIIFICKVCKKRGRYDMGNVSIDLNEYEKNKGKPIEYYAQYTGYFRCKQCNSAGQWGVIQEYTLHVVTGLMQITIAGEEDGYFSFGKNQLIDGSEHQYATDAEEHLLNKIMDTPTDALLWNGLANLYYAASRADLAAAAYEHSLLLEPMQTESYYSLGIILENIVSEKAINYYYKVLISARHYHKIDALHLRNLIAITLNNLMRMRIFGDNQLELTPGMEVYKELNVEFPTPEKDQPHVLKLEVESDNLESFYPLAEYFMGNRKNELSKAKKAALRKNRRK